MKPTQILNLSFIPSSSDLGLLLLRMWLGLSMFVIHGLGKLQDFGATVTKFHEMMGIPTVFGAAAIISESVCAILLVIGLATRWAAGFLAITMTVAFVKVHQMILTQGNPRSGELAFLYFGGFVALFIAGAGRFSVDHKLSR
jgi:putative oxidoreductase